MSSIISLYSLFVTSIEVDRLKASLPQGSDALAKSTMLMVLRFYGFKANLKFWDIKSDEAINVGIECEATTKCEVTTNGKVVTKIVMLEH